MVLFFLAISEPPSPRLAPVQPSPSAGRSPIRMTLCSHSFTMRASLAKRATGWIHGSCPLDVSMEVRTPGSVTVTFHGLGLISHPTLNVAAMALHASESRARQVLRGREDPSASRSWWGIPTRGSSRAVCAASYASYPRLVPSLSNPSKAELVGFLVQVQRCTSSPRQSPLWGRSSSSKYETTIYVCSVSCGIRCRLELSRTGTRVRSFRKSPGPHLLWMDHPELSSMLAFWP